MNCWFRRFVITVLAGAAAWSCSAASSCPADWAIAWKYPPARQMAEIKSVDFSIGRTGKINVVLNLNPLQLDDKSVRRVNVGSLSRWRRWDVLPGDHGLTRTLSQWRQFPGIGVKLAEEIMAFLHHPIVVELIARISRQGVET